MHRNSNKSTGVLFLVMILLIAGTVFIWKKNSGKVLSPVPSEPDFKVIYYTPAPSKSDTLSTPSATPKVKTPTVKPSAAPTAKVTVTTAPKNTVNPSQ